MPYSSPSDVREILGITVAEADDTLLNSLISKADRVIYNIIAIEVKDGIVGDSKGAEGGPTIDGTNKKYYTKYYPLADIDFDSDVDPADVTVYLWSDATDETTKSVTTVSSVTARTGLIQLATAPDPTKVEKITIDYSYYLYDIDFDLLKLASTFYAAYLYIIRELMLMPDDIKWAGISHKYKEKPLQMYKEFSRVMSVIRKKPFKRIEVEWTDEPRRWEEYETGEVTTT